jgi:hypothetical protein
MVTWYISAKSEGTTVGGSQDMQFFGCSELAYRRITLADCARYPPNYDYNDTGIPHDVYVSKDYPGLLL